MCGIVGYLSGDRINPDENYYQIRQMTKRLFLRGPDDCGHWQDNTFGCVMGHTRLSILDLNKTGHQPMHSFSGRYVLSFNGEIYNHYNLRETINKIKPTAKWRGTSDTETLLAGFDTFGVRKTIKLAVGMFAIAVWDRKEKTLRIYRDRMGEKPIYYGLIGSKQKKIFVFGSNLKSIAAHKEFTPNISRDSLSSYLRFGYVPTPNSIYEGIMKLNPGSELLVSIPTLGMKISKYWDFDSVLKRQANVVDQFDIEAKKNKMRRLIEEAVKGQMVSDVPLGALLSGGIDSSTIVSIMQAFSNKPVNTFSIGFDQPEYNEAGFASDVAKHLGTNHHELFISSSDMLKTVDRIADAYDEPFSDSSQIPTMLVSQLARKNVKVVLTGDGADEIFGGYNRYFFCKKIWEKLKFFPVPLRNMLSKIILAVPQKKWNSFLHYLPYLDKKHNWGTYLHRAAEVLSYNDIYALYMSLVSTWRNPGELILGQSLNENDTWNMGKSFSSLTSVERLMAMDCKTYLLDDILVKVDRASMYYSLETRVPFLDHRLVEFSWQMPESMKVGSTTKVLLRDILKDFVPMSLIDRPKMGFGVPLKEWLEGPLKSFANDLLSKDKISRESFFEPEKVYNLLNGKVHPREQDYNKIWNLLMFQLWKEKYVN